MCSLPTGIFSFNQVKAQLSDELCEESWPACPVNVRHIKTHLHVFL